MTETEQLIESLIYKFGEPYRRLISSAIEYIIKLEKDLNIINQLNKEAYIYGLIERSKDA